MARRGLRHPRFRSDSAGDNTFYFRIPPGPALHRLVSKAGCASTVIRCEAMSQRNFFAELKRRNGYKVAVAYAVVGWLVMQVAATIVPALHLPDSLTTAVVVLVLLGFPIALVIAWAFEMTPEGMKRTENVQPNEKLPQWSRKKFVRVIVALALAAAGLLAWQLLRSYVPAPRHSEAATALDKSIAVLPLVNQSGDSTQEYFSDGLSEEL